MTSTTSPWPLRPLGELAADEPNSITDGPFGSNLKTEHYTKSGPRVIRLANIGDGVFIDERAHISEEHFSRLQKHRVFAGDLVIAALGERPPRSCIVPDDIGPAIVKADCIRFKPNASLLPKFVNYVLNSEFTRRQMASIVHGVGRPRLNLKEIKTILIPLPRVSDQRRIVAEIDKYLSRIDSGSLAVTSLRDKLTAYRAEVLRAVFAGKASKQVGCREPLCATTLVEQVLDERRREWAGKREYEEPAPPDKVALGAPTHWSLASLEQLTSSNRVICYGILMPKANVPDGIPYVKVRDIRADRIDVERLHRTSREIAAKYARAALKPGDLLIAIRGSYGRVAEVPSGLDGANITQDTARLAITHLMDRRYVAWYLRSPAAQDFLKRAARGVAVKGVNIGDLRRCPVPVPPLLEQHAIVAEVELHASAVEELQRIVDACLNRARILRESILEKAFSGQL